MDGIGAIWECHSRIVVIVCQGWHLDSAHVTGSVLAGYEQLVVFRGTSGIEQNACQILSSVHVLYRLLGCLRCVLVSVKKNRLHGQAKRARQ